MKYYMEANDEEIKLRHDEIVYLDGYSFLPVEIRDVDELTDEELAGFLCQITKNESLEVFILVLKDLDELRMKPRETEKEKWIREYMKTRFDKPGDSVILSEALSAAYEAGKQAKED